MVCEAVVTDKDGLRILVPAPEWVRQAYLRIDAEYRAAWEPWVPEVGQFVHVLPSPECRHINYVGKPPHGSWTRGHGDPIPPEAIFKVVAVVPLGKVEGDHRFAIANLVGPADAYWMRAAYELAPVSEATRRGLEERGYA